MRNFEDRKEVKSRLKAQMKNFNRQYEVSQDDMIEITEEILIELKTQEFRVPSLEKAIEGEASE